MTENTKKVLNLTAIFLILLNFLVVYEEYNQYVWLVIGTIFSTTSYMDYKVDQKKSKLYGFIFWVVITIAWLIMIIFPR